MSSSWSWDALDEHFRPEKGYRMRRVAIAGHICVDITPAIGPSTLVEPGRLFEVGSLGIRLGGCVANTGSALADLGLPVHVYAAVGDDELGALAERQLAEHTGVHGALKIVSGSSTSYSLVIEPEGHDRTFWHHTGTNRFFDGTDIPLANFDILHLGYPSLLPHLLANDGQDGAVLLRRAREAGVTTSLDLAVIDPTSETGNLQWESILRTMIAETDIVSPSLDDLTSALHIDVAPDDELIDCLSDLLISWGAAVVAISAGERGLSLRTASAVRLATAGRALAEHATEWADVRLHLVPQAVAAPWTTNGVGDASTAGLLYAIAGGAGPQDACDLAMTCSAAIMSGQRTTPAAIIGMKPALAALVDGDTIEVVADTKTPALGPVRLPANQPSGRFYRGGARIADFRGDNTSSDRSPEDWIASTTSIRDHGPLGLTTVDDGTLLVDAIEREPVAWLGPDHMREFGTDTRLLVKLLDAGQRLPVHAHPAGPFALKYLGAPHGKAEAWHLLTPGTLYLGLRRDVSLDELAILVETQNSDALLDLMHRVDLEANQTVYVPPGVLHAIGAGILLVEVQEPADMSILLEWKNFELDGPADGHLGLGFDRALSAVEATARTPDEIAALISSPTGSVNCLPAEAAPYFRLEQLQVNGRKTVERGFAVLIGIDGDLNLTDEDGASTSVQVGATILLPYAAGSQELNGFGTALVARPPAPGLRIDTR